MQPVSTEQRQTLLFNPAQTQPRRSALDAQKDKLRDATRDFEAIFVRQLLNSMNATLMEGGLFGEGTAGAIYSDLMNSAIADRVTERGSIGLADILFQRMVKCIDPGEGDAAASQPTHGIKDLQEK